MTSIHQMGDIIAEKYKIVKLLGQGGAGTTYEAENLNNSLRVAIKVTSLRQSKDWKILELFEREAKILASLSHPAIPKYVDYFHFDTAEDRYFYLVRELIIGESLFDLVEKNGRITEEEVKEIAIQVLDILKYLHQQQPPIIHRDLKPQNLIKSQDGKLFLVDFGSVQEVYRQTLSGGSTFVGTLGYMPPEQLRGQTSFASDLYSLGATLLFLLTQQCPDDLPQQRMKINFRSQVKISDKLANWLDKLLEPIAEERFQSVEESLDAFYSDHKFPKPANSQIVLKRTNNSLKIKIPYSGVQGKRWSKKNFYVCLFLIFFNISWWVVTYIISLAMMSKTYWVVGGVVPLLSIIPWMITLYSFKPYILANFGQTYIEIDRQTFKFSNRLLGFGKLKKGKTEKIQKVENQSSDYEIYGYNLVYCAIEGEQIFYFGTGIKLEEQEWLVAEIRDFLEQYKEKSSKN